MQNKTIHIKNMVCPRCIDSVKNIFAELNLDISSITLGEVVTPKEITKYQKIELHRELLKRGFELLEDNKSKLIDKIKTLIINSIHYPKDTININFSTYLSDKLHQDYGYLSRLFSSIEGITIEKFVLSQKIEKAKELLFYDELTLSEIAFQMHYSSVAYLSSQFKKETGMTPTQFKKQKKPGHNHLDNLQS
ncbi:helix-turn-helix domain-containing protein [Aquimarina muelleri]